MLFLSCKANARVKLAKSGHGPHLYRIIVFCVVLVIVLCYHLYAVLLYCYCVAMLLFVLSYVLIVCTVSLPAGVNPIAVDKYIISYSPWRSVTARVVLATGNGLYTRLVTTLKDSKLRNMYLFCISCK